MIFIVTAAMKKEIDEIKKSLQSSRKFRVFTDYSDEIGVLQKDTLDRDIVFLVETGIGKLEASLHTYQALKKLPKARVVLNVGCCGTNDDQLLNKVIVASDIYEGDFNDMENIHFVKTNSGIYNYLRQEIFSLRIPLITTDQFINSEVYAQELTKYFRLQNQSVAFDMEAFAGSYAVSQVPETNAMFIPVKIVSDCLGQNYNEFWESVDARRIGEVTIKALTFIKKYLNGENS